MSASKNRYLSFQVITRVDRDTMDRFTWYASQRGQPLSVVLRDALVEHLDTYMNAATRLGERYHEERQAHAMKLEGSVDNGSSQHV